MPRALRLLLATVLLATVAAPLLPVPASAGPGCAMCSRNCCCRPPGAREACRLSRPCGSPGEDAAPAAQSSSRPALLDAIPPGAAPPLLIAAAPFPFFGLPVATADPPPVPPPRSFSTCWSGPSFSTS